MIFAAYYSGHVPPEASLIEFSSESRQPSLYLPNFLSFRGRKFGSISKGERIWEEGGIKILLLRKGDRGAFLFLKSWKSLRIGWKKNFNYCVERSCDIRRGSDWKMNVAIKGRISLDFLV